MGKVLVFGSFVVDLMSRTPHLPVPGETVKGSVFKMGPGREMPLMEAWLRLCRRERIFSKRQDLQMHSRHCRYRR